MAPVGVREECFQLYCQSRRNCVEKESAISRLQSLCSYVSPCNENENSEGNLLVARGYLACSLYFQPGSNAESKAKATVIYEELFPVLYEVVGEENCAHMYLILHYCYFDVEGVCKDEIRSVNYCAKAAELGLSGAQCRLGYCYSEGIGVEKDKAEALRLYSLAAEQNYGIAYNNIGVIYETVEKNFTEAVKYYRISADLLDEIGQYNLGACYLYGRGVESNPVEAVRLFQLAATAGDIDAQCCLGYCYLKGEGINRNYEKAVEMFRKTAHAGNIYSQFALGSCYEDGIGLQENLMEAVKWYKAAFDKGDPSAAFSLGRLYERGMGVETDVIQAVRCFKLVTEKLDQNSEILVAAVEALRRLRPLYKDALWGNRKSFLLFLTCYDFIYRPSHTSFPNVKRFNITAPLDAVHAVFYILDMHREIASFL